MTALKARIVTSGDQQRHHSAIHLSLTVADDETFHAIFRSIPELKRQFPEIQDVRARVRNPFIAPHDIGLAILLASGAMARGAAQKLGADVYGWLKKRFGKNIDFKHRRRMTPKSKVRDATKKPTMGAHWEQTRYPINYQLSRRVQDVADELADQKRHGRQPLRKHVEELCEISHILKGLELKPKR